MDQKILITGASGFIGRHLVRTALDRGMAVYAGIRATSNRTFLNDPRIRIFPFDMADMAKVYADLKQFQQNEGGFQFVIHNAGINRPNDILDFVTGNADITREFARMLMETQPQMRKFVFMSSMAAIGPGNPVTMQPLDERHPRNPVTPYGHSKLLAERYVHEIDTLPYIILRPTGVYGPGDEKFMLRLIRLIQRGFEVSIGPTDQQISLIHAADLARLAIDVLFADVSREDFNISDGEFYTQKAIYGAIREVMGGRTLKLRIPSRVMMASGFVSYHTGRILKRPVHLTHMKVREVVARNWKVDIRKSVEMLGFSPQFDLLAGMHDVVASMKN